MQLQTLLDWLAGFAPLRLAEEWDNVGLLLGDPAQPARKVLTCLTITPPVVAEAIEGGAELIVSHHPILFKPTQRLTTASAEGRLLLPLLKAGIAVYSPHTAFDNCVGGINDLLAGRLKLQAVQSLRTTAVPAQHKLVAFVPEADLRKVSEALFAAGAGRIGAYEQCSFRAAGVGSFFGTESANPAVGQKGRREETPEWRLEVVVPSVKLEAAARALRQAHSYEEPAFDVYPLAPTPCVAPAGEGVGRLGDLAEALPLKELARRTAEALWIPSLAFIGAADRPIRRVGICCGAGGSLLGAAQAAGAEVFLTGELRFHDQLAAQERGLAVLLAGHYATERPGVERLADLLAAAFPALEVWASRTEQDPAQLSG